MKSSFSRTKTRGGSVRFWPGLEGEMQTEAMLVSKEKEGPKNIALLSETRLGCLRILWGPRLPVDFSILSVWDFLGEGPSEPKTTLKPATRKVTI